MKKQLVAAAAVGILGAATIAGVGVASAQTTTSNTNLVDKIASTFNLNKDEVQKVFDADKAERDAQREADVKAKLDQAVKDGTLTQAQEDKLIAKFKEMQAQREANRDSMDSKTEAERRTAMQTERDAFKQWLTDNGIPEEYGRFGMGRGGHGGPGGHRMDDTTSGTSDSSSTTDGTTTN